MDIVLIILLILLFCGGGWGLHAGYWGPTPAGGTAPGYNPLGILLLVVLVLIIIGLFAPFWHHAYW